MPSNTGCVAPTQPTVHDKLNTIAAVIWETVQSLGGTMGKLGVPPMDECKMPMEPEKGEPTVDEQIRRILDFAEKARGRAVEIREFIG